MITRARHAVIGIVLAVSTSTAFDRTALARDPLPATAAAPPVDDTRLATTLFVRGSQLFKGHRYDLALDQFQRSYEVVKSPNSHLYIARCIAALGDARGAYLEFEKVEVEAAERALSDPKYAKTRDSAELERAELAPRLAFIAVRVVRPGPGTRVRIGRAEVPRERWGKPFPVAPGMGAAVIETEGKPARTESFTIAAGETRELSLDADAAVGGAVPAQVVRPSTPSLVRVGAFAAGSTGVLGLVLFSAAGVASQATYSDLKARCGVGGGCSGQSVSTEIANGKSQQLVANVGLGIGLVGLAAGAGLFAWSLHADAKPTVGVAVGPSWVGVTGRF